jgi:hypothetical protein
VRRPRPDDAETLALQQAFLDDLNGRRPRSNAERDLAFRRPPRGSSAGRWHVYAHGYVARIEEAMGLEHAATRRILGADAFADLVTRYVGVFPPRSWDLANAGDRLPGFLELDSLTAELPFLPDLATLERAVAHAFVAADGDALSWEALARRGADEVSTLRLALMPGVRVLRSPWPLHALWACRLEEGDDAVSVPIEGLPARVLVSELEASLVEAASCGDATLEELRELAGAGDEASLVEAFRALVEREVFVLKRSTGWTGALVLPKEAFS